MSGVFSGWSRSSAATGGKASVCDTACESSCMEEGGSLARGSVVVSALRTLSPQISQSVERALLSPRASLAQHSHEKRTEWKNGCDDHHSSVMLSPREHSDDSKAIAEKLRLAITNQVLADSHTGPIVVSATLPPLPPVPNLCECDFIAGKGELERADKTAAYSEKLKRAALQSDADKSERELLLQMCDFLQCATQHLTEHQRTVLSTNLDDGIQNSAEKHMVPAIRDFVKLESMRAKAPAFAEMEKKLAAVQKAEDACQDMADVRGRKQALQEVWQESYRSGDQACMHACNAQQASRRCLPAMNALLLTLSPLQFQSGLFYLIVL